MFRHDTIVIGMVAGVIIERTVLVRFYDNQAERTVWSAKCECGCGWYVLESYKAACNIATEHMDTGEHDKAVA